MLQESCVFSRCLSEENSVRTMRTLPSATERTRDYHPNLLGGTPLLPFLMGQPPLAGPGCSENVEVGAYHFGASFQFLNLSSLSFSTSQAG